MAQERTGIITFKGNPMTLLGPDVKVGDAAPDFQVVDNGLQPVTLTSAKGKVQLIAVVPSLDTPVCDTMTRKFNEEAAKLPADVAVYTISLDLPFAQKRWCGNAGIEKVQTLSDYQERSFGLAYGVLIKELKLLARSVFVIDKDRQGRLPGDRQGSDRRARLCCGSGGGQEPALTDRPIAAPRPQTIDWQRQAPRSGGACLLWSWSVRVLSRGGFSPEEGVLREI